MKSTSTSPIITIVGDSLICIENFCSIVCYEADKLKVKTAERIVTVYGMNLSISYFDNEEILIKGVISNISFADGLYGG